MEEGCFQNETHVQTVLSVLQHSSKCKNTMILYIVWWVQWLLTYYFFACSVVQIKLNVFDWHQTVNTHVFSYYAWYVSAAQNQASFISNGEAYDFYLSLKSQNKGRSCACCECWLRCPWTQEGSEFLNLVTYIIIRQQTFTNIWPGFVRKLELIIHDLNQLIK